MYKNILIVLLVANLIVAAPTHACGMGVFSPATLVAIYALTPFWYAKNKIEQASSWFKIDKQEQNNNLQQ